MRFLPWRRLRGLKRYREVAQALVKYGYVDVVEALRLDMPLRFGRRLLGRPEAPPVSKPVRLRLLCEELGPTFIKLGQLLSTRPDLLPPEYLRELARLQDHAPSEDFAAICATVQEELGRPLTELFASIDAAPLAAASIAQVHRATLPGGERVILKVQRPGIRQVIQADLDLLRDLARLAERYLSELRPLQPTGLVEEFARSIAQELDFRHELRNLQRCAQLFADDPTVYVPKAYPELSTARVLTMEYVEGIKITDREALCAAGLDPRAVAVNGANALLKQVFVHGFFQADPHPGNLVVRKDNTIAILDYGMFGTIDAETREQLATLLLGLVQRDVAKILRALAGLEVLSPELNRRQLRRDLTMLADTYLTVPLEQLDLSTLVEEVMQVVRRHGLRLPSDFYLLLRALITAESLGRELDPSFSIMEHLRPFAERLVMERYDPRYLLRKLGHTAEEAEELLLFLPAAAMQILDKLRRGELHLGLEVQQLDRLMREFDTASNRLTLAIILAASIIGSSLILLTEMPPLLFGYPALGLIGFTVAGVLGFGLVIAILRSGGF
ncbi:MAG: ubiquinone biosynthesis protein UbiB [Candidatus Tectimicrobiota bacterium]|nr:MAG: ubiquinone biosynthesis protein UbiB [Candidatus Tectomicrobia bacterium]